MEATALGKAIEAFYEFIKQSTKLVIICPDSKAVVDAAKKLSKGQFSLSPRIQTFFNNLGKINHDIQHILGKSGHNAAPQGIFNQEQPQTAIQNSDKFATMSRCCCSLSKGRVVRQSRPLDRRDLRRKPLLWGLSKGLSGWWGSLCS